MDRLFGWDLDTWDRLFDWAGTNSIPIYDNRNFPELLALRRRWLERGGPMGGPSGSVKLK